jgi:predicted nucleic acid-binding protein
MTTKPGVWWTAFLFTVMKDLKLTQSLTADKDFEQAGFEILLGK